MDDKKEKEQQFTCPQCKFVTKNSRSMQKHQWTWHPSNNIERAWAKHAREGFMNWTGSSYYESYGPYY